MKGDIDPKEWVVPDADDRHAPARGCVNGLLLGAVLWTVAAIAGIWAWG